MQSAVAPSGLEPTTVDYIVYLRDIELKQTLLVFMKSTGAGELSFVQMFNPLESWSIRISRSTIIDMNGFLRRNLSPGIDDIEHSCHWLIVYGNSVECLW